MLEKLEQEVLSKLLNCANNQKCSVAVVGSGYVGLPTAALFAQAGFDVTAIDIRESIVESISNGISPINEPGLAALLSQNVESRQLKAELLCNCTFRDKNVIIITVQTPLGEDKKPDLSFLMRAVKRIGEELQKETLVAVCSTVPPGTMHRKIEPLLSSLTGFVADEDFYLAYVPERIAPGTALKEFVESPRLIGGIGPRSTRIASEVFKKVCKNVLETDSSIAEIAKTAENTFRDINIAFANQLALICEQCQVDVLKVIALANTHPRVNIHSPGPGVGGPCLTKDPYLLVSETDLPSKSMVETARQTNDCMPHHMVELVVNGLERHGKSLRNSNITVLGAAYKSNVDDSRCSPSQQIIHELLFLSANVTVYDPYCPETFGAKAARSIIDSARGSDCIMIVTDHDDFKNLDLHLLKKMMKQSPIIVDGKRIIEPSKATGAGFSYCGVGYGQTNRSSS